MPGAQKVTPAMLALAIVYLLLWPLVLLWLSGDWGWIEGWIFAVWFVALFGICIVWLYRHDPALLAERFRKPGTGGQSRADRWITFGLMVCFVFWILLPPLDARRFGWTPRLPVWVEAAGGLLLLGAVFFLFRSFTDNTFLSPLVRIQSERSQTVVSTGVYGRVRHPMYLGAILMSFGAPLLLSSAWALIPALGLTLLLLIRIGQEEDLLVRDLEGYRAYRERVRFRLVPYIW